MQTWTYGVAIEHKDGDYVVSVCDLPEVVTAGDTPTSIAAASLDRPAADPHAAPRLAGRATAATRLVVPDPSAVSQPSSQPPPLRCCDDLLNPP